MERIDAYRYDRKRTDSQQVEMIKDRLIYRLLSDELVPRLKGKRVYHAVKLDMREDSCLSGLYSMTEDIVELRVRLEINEGERRVIEYIDYRPMDWMTLSQSATEEIRRRIRNWWRRPLSTRMYVWKRRIDAIERRHFGYAFDGKKCP